MRVLNPSATSTTSFGVDRLPGRDREEMAPAALLVDRAVVADRQPVETVWSSRKSAISSSPLPENRGAPLIRVVQRAGDRAVEFADRAVRARRAGEILRSEKRSSTTVAGPGARVEIEAAVHLDRVVHRTGEGDAERRVGF
jgi:hypothetical protein